ncbi:MAG: hypothetical protein WA324_00930 [Bryobacteraceae bacterium]
MLALLGASFLTGILVGHAQAAANLPPIWEISKWIALGRELDRTLPLLERDKAELINVMKAREERR